MKDHKNTAMRVIKTQADALEQLSKNLPKDFNAVADAIISCKGRVILSGIGKSGYIARKIAASLASTGTLSSYIHPAEASHGDLGMISQDDIVIMLSNSGETKELSDILSYCKRFAIKVIAMTMNHDSTLAKNSDFLLLVPKLSEASNVAAPTTSALMMLSLGDALMVATHEAKGFSSEDFKIYHPGGKLGANLLKVIDVMKKGPDLPIVTKSTSFADTIIIITRMALGCALVVSDDMELEGIITDGDLRRHMGDIAKIQRAEDLMTHNPITIDQAKLAAEALNIINRKSITVLPVTEGNKLVGLVHIHDLLTRGIG